MKKQVNNTNAIYDWNNDELTNTDGEIIKRHNKNSWKVPTLQKDIVTLSTKDFDDETGSKWHDSNLKRWTRETDLTLEDEIEDCIHTFRSNVHHGYFEMYNAISPKVYFKRREIVLDIVEQTADIEVFKRQQIESKRIALEDRVNNKDKWFMLLYPSGKDERDNFIDWHRIQVRNLTAFNKKYPKTK